MKVSKEQQKKLDDVRERFTKARNEFEIAQDDANEQIAKLRDTLNAKIADLNSLVEEANGVREEIADDAQNYYDEKSEKWQEGERGSTFSDWLSSWQNEVEEIEEIDEIVFEKIDEIPEAILSEDDYPNEPSF